MTIKNIRTKVLQIISNEFEISLSSLSENMGPDNISKWDSMGGLTLMLEIEKQFNLEFEVDDLLKISNINDIIMLIEKCGLSKNITKIDEQYEIGICPSNSINELKSFINSHWSKENIFLKSNELLDWQHLNKNTNDYNFVIARNNNSNEIDCILGFIPTKQFDGHLSRLDLWLAIWKVKENLDLPGLGIKLIRFLETEFRPNSISSIGINAEVLPAYKMFKFDKIGILKHYYMINESKNEHNLIKINNEKISSSNLKVNNKKSFFLCDKDQLIDLDIKGQLSFWDSQIPIKSIEYIINRYCKHPIYKYSVYIISERDKYKGLFISRICKHENYRALRIVDFIGPSHSLEGTYHLFQSLIKKCGAEYLDCYNIGIQSNDFFSAGFSLRDKSSDIIIPNYFEPFERKNVDLTYAYKIYGKSNTEKFRFFKGDCDQDRPNQI